MTHRIESHDSVSSMAPDVMLQQANELASDLRENLASYDEQARRALTLLCCRNVSTVYLVGCGDSLHAGYAARMAFHSIAGVKCIPMSAQEFVGYSALQLQRAAGEQVIVMGTSASAKTERVVDAIERAKAYGAPTLAITGNPDGPVAKAADVSLTLAVRQTRRSPGVRTFQASLLGMLLLAIALGELRGHLTSLEAATWRDRLARMAPIINIVKQRFMAPCAKIAEVIAASSTLYFVGSGPSFGTALFSAAKMVEACGMFAVAQDVEEWWHVERFAYPVETPMCIFAPQGHSQSQAIRLAERASELGRRVFVITSDDQISTKLRRSAPICVPNEVCEELSPLAYGVFASLLAHFAAARLGRAPFQTLT